MRNTRWLNPSQPQTLQSAVILLYINAALSLLFSFGALNNPFILLSLGGIGAGWGIANEHKWGYGLGIGVALAPFVLSVVFLRQLLPGGLINSAFAILLVVLLLHPHSRDYQRVWFK